MENVDAPVTYLDKKWFYTSNCHRRIKKLPRGRHEEEGVDTYKQPKVRSRRFPVKSMFMGVVGRPIAAKQLDGKVHLERISENKEVKKLTTNTKFCDNYSLNSLIKEGGWRDLHTEGSTVEEMRDALQLEYGLNNYIVDLIEFQY